MKNEAYPLYEIAQIRDLKEMLWLKQQEMPEGAAFTYPMGHGVTKKKTYEEFYREVNALGTWEYMQGFHGVHIGIIGGNSYEWLAAFFSIVNGGNVAVPIDKELPGNEIVVLLKKADVKAVFVSDTCRRKLDAVEEEIGDIRIFSMEAVEAYIAEGQKSIIEGEWKYLEFKPDVKEPCCIMFTSGTSGASKGVMLSHENFAADINGSCRLVVLNGATVALLPFHHAFGLVVGVMMVFHYGYTIYINLSLRKVSNSLKVAKPQNLFLVPLFVENFHRQIWAAVQREGKSRMLKRLMKISDALLSLGIDVRKRWFASVREAFGNELEYIISGGAGIDISYIREFRSWGVEILNGYGTTECAPVAAVNRNHYYKDGSVGLPVPGTEVKLAEDGEVWVRGNHVMLGYYKDTEATDEVLKSGWYATGDLGYLDKDGFLTLTGRKKNLIILSNGENISPEELEQDFLGNEAVREVVVYAKDGVIMAEIYPEEDYLGNERYFELLMKKVNHRRPIYKQVGKIKLRDTEFEKNTSQKIIRYR